MVTVGLMWIAMLMHGQAGTPQIDVHRPCYGLELQCGVPEPQDVPAVNEMYRSHYTPDRVRCDMDDPEHGIYGAPCHLWYWTCADKRRVLLTDESGKRHCILFGGGQ